MIKPKLSSYEPLARAKARILNKVSDITDRFGEAVSIGVTLSVLGVGIATIAYGPIDMVRAGYSTLSGETETLKKGLIGNTESNLRLRYRTNDPKQVDALLASAFNVPLDIDGKFDIRKISLMSAFDAAEDNAQTIVEYWLWPPTK